MENSTPTNNTVRRISSLSEHRALLKEVFKTAKSRVIVVSPFVSSKALASDNIPSQIRSAVGRGVSVQVFTDQKLNTDAAGHFKQSAWDGISDMTASGAKVKIVEGIHNKTLARDSDLIAEGSFNWLSAVRIKGGENQREERTMVVQGEQAKEMIEKEVTGMGNKSVSSVTAHKKSNKGTIVVLTITAIILFSVLYFVPGVEKWWVFGMFAIGLSPFVWSVLKQQSTCSGYETLHQESPLDEFDDGSNYIPGVRDFDGTYFAEKDSSGY